MGRCWKSPATLAIKNTIGISQGGPSGGRQPVFHVPEFASTRRPGTGKLGP
jgi:hypothetical protein